MARERMDVLVHHEVDPTGFGTGQVVTIIVDGKVERVIGYDKHATPSQIAASLKSEALNTSDLAESDDSLDAFPFLRSKDQLKKDADLLMKASGKVPGLGF